MTEEPSGTQTWYLEDGTVQVCYSGPDGVPLCGWVSSCHLVIPKALQLKTAYLNAKKNGLPDS